MKYFNSVADILDAKFNGHQRYAINPADKGELCEIFVKDAINDLFSNVYNVNRGGNIIDTKENYSKQIDIVLTAKNTLSIFGDKGIYPVESVAGVFCITATLDKTKLFDDIEVLKSIPINAPSLYLSKAIPDEDGFLKNLYRRFPFKCVFAFTGNLKAEMENELNKIIDDTNMDARTLPDLVVINKNCCIYKTLERPDEKYKYVFFSLKKNPGQFCSYMIHHLYEIALMRNYAGIVYSSYFNVDILKCIEDDES